jgi:glycogen synthase
MFGWEFPPFKSGGLGTACKDLTKGLSKLGTEITFVMPQAPDGAESDNVKIIGCNNLADRIKIRKIGSILTPYMTSEGYLSSIKNAPKMGGKNEVYGMNLYEEVARYSEAAKFIAEEEEFDVIHVHDWMTYQAGMNAKEISGKPLIAHIHATEFDRTGGNPNSHISHVEYTGLKAADKVIANSEFTKQNVIKHYDIDPSKIEVVHWGIDPDNPHFHMEYESQMKKDGEKIVLSLGRVTVQKGVDHLVHAAKKVLEHEKNVKFMVVGDGDMLPKIIDMTVEYGISDKFIFTGWLKGADIHKAFKMADMFIMPSVSEPFGLVALESMRNGTPVILSKTSGASEVMNHCLKVDFWDVDRMANLIISMVRYPELDEEISENSYRESSKFNLEKPARKCIDIYKSVVV